ncbi:MAG: glycosyltransferase, partial [Clostridiales bacterium]|nr:glycosyltransferase [Clostridiales bacterium]
YQILVKPHQAVYKHIAKDGDRGNLIPSSIDTNELLSIVDILISDYSSIYFDFMVTDNPVLFYIPDLKEYEGYRGIYFRPEELPGPATENIDDIADWINKIDEVKSEYNDIYQKTKSWACEYDDGNVSKKIIDIVFKGNEKDYNILSNFADGRKKILIHRGSSKTNGVTISMMNLLNNIDYDKYDVTVYLATPTTIDGMENIDKMSDNARAMCRVSTFNSTLFEDFCNGIYRKVGLRNFITKLIFPKKLYEREYRRCFGQVDFDYVIDFSGYSSFFSALLLQAENAKKIIWQHSDMGSELITRAAVHGSNINASITLFPHYDKIVSATEEVMKANIKNFATKGTKDKFTYSTNLIDLTRIQRCLKGSEKSIVHIDGRRYISNRIKKVGDAISIEMPVPIDSSKINFVTMGRMSPEKNHMNLIDGFAKIREDNPDCRLYIIGDGPLRRKIEDNIASMGLSDVVHLTGNLSNPFPLLSQCDCFVFPSLYEAQGLVVLEARMLNLPIILSDFDAAPSVMMENGQLLIGKESNDIYEGMKAFLNGEVPTDYKFDPQEYNKKAY